MDIKTEQYIRELYSQVTIINGVEDDEVKDSLVKLLCIRTAGLLEVFLKTRISEYSKGKVPKEINRYITAKFKDITNLKSSKLFDVLSTFSEDWALKFQIYLNEHEQEKSSLDSIIANRHNIAHGQQSGIRSTSIHQYLTDVINIVNFLDKTIR